MKTTYVLIDHENVQPKDLALLNGQPGSRHSDEQVQ